MTISAQEHETTAVKALPWRICLISGNGPDTIGGLASYLRCLADGLSGDHAVSVAVRFSQTAVHADMYAGAEQFRVISHGSYQICIIAPRNIWRPTLRRLASLVSRPSLQRLALWIYCQAYRPSMATVIPASTNIVHYIGVGWELLGFAALAEARRRRAAFTIWPAVHPGTWGDSPLDISLYNQADAIFVQSESERIHLIQLGVEPFRLHQCGLAPIALPDGDGLAFRRRHDLGERPLVLFIGRKDQSKGYHALREAMPIVLAAVPDACLVAIGPDREPPYPPVPGVALLDLGKADEAEKADALAACDVFCLPSVNEAFGIVYVEAWSYAKPVVGGLAPAVRELITDGVTGFCTSQNPDEIATVLTKLLLTPVLRQKLGAAGRELQQNRFTWPAVMDQHVNVFSAALSAVEQRRLESTGYEL